MPIDSKTSTDQVGNRPGRLAGKIAVITGNALYVDNGWCAKG